jgi:ABC-type dipeptide/oligopeptide/nickel transport system permease subunit
MTLALGTTPAEPEPQAAEGLWALGWRRLRKDRVGMTCLFIVAVYVVICFGGALGFIGANWRDEVAKPYAPPTLLQQFAPQGAEVTAKAVAAANANTDPGRQGLTTANDPLADMLAGLGDGADQYKTEEVTLSQTLVLGADQRGRDIWQKILKGTSVSMFIGLIGALCAVTIGTIMGAFAGYFGRRIDDFLMWFYSVFTSIPDMLLLLSFAAVLSRGINTVVLVFALTSWTGTFRLIRAEYMRAKTREYVMAADAIGASHLRRMFIHILPNVSHLLLVQFSLLTIGMIMSEAVLSFLGFGVGITQTSWGAVLAEVPAELLQGYWWQMAAVTVFMSILITAFSMLTDSLRDALDPRVA